MAKPAEKKETYQLWLFFVAFIAVSVVNAQAVSVPLEHPSYRFLDRMEAKGLIEQVRDGTKPFSRLKVAEILLQIEEDPSSNLLTKTERDELHWLKRQFQCELEALGKETPTGSVSSPRWWAPFPRREKEGVVCLDPVAAFSSQSRGSVKVYHRTTGVKVYGYLKDTVGFYLYARDSGEWAKKEIRWKPEDPQQGLWDVPFPKKGIGYSAAFGKRIDHDEVDAELSLKFPWFSLSLEKGSNIWGPGYRGQLALSDWAPSYGQIRLSAQYGNWLDFTYIHAFLYSGIVDSIGSYRTEHGYQRTLYKRKYIAGHRLEITPIPGVDVGVSETVIYGDRAPEPLYLLPVMFFWSAQHYINDLDNLQVSVDIELSLIANLKLYGAFLIDELYLAKAFTREHHNWVGMQAGLFWVNLIQGLDLRAEYTRINPGVYSHKFPIASFESYGYLLGHQIGQNADQLFLEASYQYTRPLRMTLSCQLDRKGDVRDPYEQYSEPSQSFMTEVLNRRQVWRLEGSYEPRRSFFLKVGYQLISAPKAEKNELFFGIEYNL